MDAKMATEIFNTTSAQPESPQSWAYKTSQLQGALPDFLAEWSAWQYVVTFLVGLVLYDQGN